MKNIDKPFLYIIILASALGALLAFKLSALYFSIFILGVMILFIAKVSKESVINKKFLITFILLMFIVRFLLSLFYFNARGGELTQDEGLYSKKALIKVCEAKGIEGYEQCFSEYFNDYDMTNLSYGYNVYTSILTRFYRVFGYQVQAVRLVNILMSIMIFIILFYLAKELFGSATAKISSGIFAFYPSVALWSVAIGTDISALFGIAIYLLGLIRLIKSKRWVWGVVAIAGYLFTGSFKWYVGPVLIAIPLIIMILSLFFSMTRKGKLTAIATALLIIYAITISPIMMLVDAGISYEMFKFARQQRSFAIADDSGYFIYPSRYYKALFDCKAHAWDPDDIMAAYIKGMGYVLFSPFPWKIDSKLQLMALPQVILWYVMLPFIIFGFYIGFRKNKLETAPIFLYTVILFSIFALAEGNVGALFRHKDMVMPFLIIYFSAAFSKLFLANEQKERIN